MKFYSFFTRFDFDLLIWWTLLICIPYITNEYQSLSNLSTWKSFAFPRISSKHTIIKCKLVINLFWRLQHPFVHKKNMHTPHIDPFDMCRRVARPFSLDVHAFETFVFSLFQFKLLSSFILCLIETREAFERPWKAAFTDGRENECGMVTTATGEEKSHI